MDVEYPAVEIRDSLSVGLLLDADIFEELVRKTKFSPDLLKGCLSADLIITEADSKYKAIGAQLREIYKERTAIDAAQSLLEDVFFHTLPPAQQEAFNWSVKGLTPEQKKLRRAAKLSLANKVRRAKDYAFPPEKKKMSKRSRELLEQEKAEAAAEVAAAETDERGGVSFAQAHEVNTFEGEAEEEGEETGGDDAKSYHSNFSEDEAEEVREDSGPGTPRRRDDGAPMPKRRNARKLMEDDGLPISAPTMMRSLLNSIPTDCRLVFHDLVNNFLTFFDHNEKFYESSTILIEKATEMTVLAEVNLRPDEQATWHKFVSFITEYQSTSHELRGEDELGRPKPVMPKAIMDDLRKFVGRPTDK